MKATILANNLTHTLDAEVSSDVSLEQLEIAVSHELKQEIILVEMNNSKVVGASGEKVYQAISLDLLLGQLKSTRGLDRVIEQIKLSVPQEYQDALAVRLADRVNMFGATLFDKVTSAAKSGEARYSIQAHPYPWLASGAHNVVTYQNSEQDLFVAVVYNQRRDRREATDPLRMNKVPDYFKLPEGYMHPKPCQAGEDGIALVQGDAMDEAEELMLKNQPMQTAYRTIKAKFGDHFFADDDQSHAEGNDLQTKKVKLDEQSYDKSIADCAARECFEEIGLQIKKEQMQFVAQREELGRIPVVTNVYLISTDKQSQTAPALTVDGVEIAEAVWLKVAGIHVADGKAFADYYDAEDNKYLIEIPDKHAQILDQAIAKHRDNAIQAISKIDQFSLFNSTENLVARIQQILNSPALNLGQLRLADIIGEYKTAGSLTQLGKAAHQQHQRLLAIAEAFKTPRMIHFTAEELHTIGTTGSEIQTRLLAAQTRMFPAAIKQVSQPATAQMQPALRNG